MVDHLTPSPFFYSVAQRLTHSELSKGHTMTRRATIRPLWLILLLLVSLGAKGCPAYVGCGVSGSLPHGPQGASADTWSCQVGMQIAKGQSVTTPQQAKEELLAMKDQKAVQVASLRDQLKKGDSFGFGGKDVDSQSAKVEDQDKAVFLTQAPYEPGKKYVIPYVLRSEHGEVVETGYLPVESVQVESAR